MVDQNRQQMFAERYEAGQIPWDDRLPPPEVISLADRLDAGRAVDLGSGYGRSSIYLALNGWQVDGVEFVAQAVEESRERAEEEGVSSQIEFHLADITDLDFLQEPYDLAIDIGCMHTLRIPELEMYRDSLLRLLKKDAYYLLFAHLRDADDDSEDASRWIEEGTLRQLFKEGFRLAQVDYGITRVPDKPTWPSAWFLYRRL